MKSGGVFYIPKVTFSTLTGRDVSLTALGVAVLTIRRSASGNVLCGVMPLFFAQQTDWPILVYEIGKK